MGRDHLRQPLKRRGLFARLWAKRPSLITLAYALTGAAFLAAGTWAIRTPHPFAGEPIVTAQIPPAEEIVTASTSEKSDPGSNTTDIAQSDPATGGQEPAIEEETQFAAETSDVETEPQPKSQKRPKAVIEEPVRQDVYQQEAGLVISPRRPLTPAPIASLVETSPLGKLPRISGGKKPSAAYARPTSLNVIHSDSPKIAIILGGMGLNTRLTARAIAELPADISLAFAPYGEDLQKQVDKARREGHEVLLQVPLEPVGFPASNPGPRTLLVDAGSGDNLESLYWHMTRFTGYVGLVNYMGGRFLANADAVSPLLKETRKRGLLFLEDGSLPLTATQSVAKTNTADYRKADTVIDADPSAASILSALQLLEQEAQTNGIAVGSGSGLEVTIDTLRDWAKDAAERGIIIVPVSAAFKGRLG